MQENISPRDSIKKYKKKSIECYRNGNLEGFGRYSYQVLSIAEKYDLKEARIRSLINLAIYHQRKDEYQKALAKYIKAKELTPSLQESSYLKVILNTNLGNFYYKIGDYDNAKLIMERVITLADHHKNEKTKIITSAYNTLANIASDEYKYEEALNYYNNLKTIIKDLENNTQKLATLYSNIASCYIDKNDYEKAIENLQEALNIIGKEKFIETEASIKLNMGIAHYNLKNYNKALLYLQSANQIAIKENSLEVKMKTHKFLAKVQEASNNIDEAFAQQKKYMLARESFLKTLTKTQRLRFENDTRNKLLKINKQKQIISFLNKEKVTYISLALLVLCLLLTLVFRYYKKRKIYSNDIALLKVDNNFLENENELLRDKLNKLSLSLIEQDKVKKNKKSSSISIEKQNQYKEHILNYMDEHKPYLNSEIKQLDVAKALDINLHLFSEILNTCFKQNFNSFINLYRVEQAKRLIKDPKYSNYKIMTIAYDSGFSSKPSFNRVFKKLVGCTPSEYQKKKE
ncbi:tetratricopeptide repeat protein [Tenacibaculum jejuense]|nr:tetratricopeptide repeat protein [Tenacibaculum jejuense]